MLHYLSIGSCNFDLQRLFRLEVCIFLSVGLLMEVLPFGTSLEALKLLCSWYQYLMLNNSLIVRNGQEQAGEVRVDDGGDL